MSVSHLLVDSTISSHQLCLFVLYIFDDFWIIQRNIMNVWNFSNNCMENEIAKREDVQLGGVAGVSNSTLRRHVHSKDCLGWSLVCQLLKGLCIVTPPGLRSWL